jgi:hypothetical protein
VLQRIKAVTSEEISYRPTTSRTEAGARFICIPMSRASIRLSANERKRSSSASFHGLVVKNSCPAIWTSPSPEFHKPGHTTDAALVVAA